MTSRTFSGVSVGLPAKVRGSEAEEEWQEVDWVTWSSGDLSVEGHSALLIFTPAAAGQHTGIGGKPLGSLRRAAMAGPDGDAQCTLVVTTDDAVHGQLRFTFQNARLASEFKQMADAIEAAHEAAARRGAEASSGSDGRDERATQLIRAIQDKYPSRLPLIFSGVDVFGPEHGVSEVCIGSGALVLLDPDEEESSKCIGQYSLLFYDFEDGATSTARKHFPIGPRMMLKRKPGEDASHGSSGSTQDPDVPLISFEFRQAPGMPVHTLSFDDALTASNFSRDFRVRSRLMDVSLQTAKGKHAVNEAQNEIQKLRQRSFRARVLYFFRLALLLMLVVTTVRVIQLYSQKPGKAPAQYLQQVTKDVAYAAQTSRVAAMAVGSKVCELAVGTVSTTDLQRCLAAGGVSKVRECVADLVPTTPM